MGLINSALSSGLISFLAILLGVSFFYMLIFGFAGIMAYYFTGDKPGRGIMGTMMNVGVRLYSQVFMLLSLLGMIYAGDMALGTLFGSIFTTTSRVKAASNNESVAIGLVLLMIFAFMFGMHYLLNYAVEGSKQRRGSVISKVFVFLGVSVTGIITFTALVSFATELTGYAISGPGLSNPGYSLSLFLIGGIAWSTQVVRAVMYNKTETGK